MKPETIPAPLQHFLAAQPAQPKSNLDALQPTWAEYLATTHAQLPDIQIEGEGELVCLGKLSPGCRACKDGAWDCIFITLGCNIACPFCYSPHALPVDYAGSAFGQTPAQIMANHRQTHITGISFSGGEPFAQPQMLFDWIAQFKAAAPDKYYWVYTNGLLAREEYLRRLGELGVNEIRFNLAATGYTHPTTLRNLAAAARHLPAVTVEIPAIPADAAKLLNALAVWGALGARLLNLHELMYEPGTNAATLPGPRRPVITADGHYTEIHPDSRALTLAVMQKVAADQLPLAVNDCSLQSKLRQLRGRRRSLAPLTLGAHEKLIGEDRFETVCVYPDDGRYYFCHPDSAGGGAGRYFRLTRRAPLSLNDPGQWISIEEIEPLAVVGNR